MQKRGIGHSRWYFSR